MYLEKSGRIVRKFKNNTLETDWVKQFLKRHPTLSVRFATNIKIRAALSKEILQEYIENLTPKIRDIPPTHIFNYDETNLADDPGQKRVIVRRGCKYPEKICNTSKSSNSIMFCGSASGELMPPYVVYKSQKLWDTWTENVPKGCHYSNSPSEPNSPEESNHPPRPETRFKDVRREKESFVVVKYDEKLYPGLIIDFDEKGATVDAMTKSLKSWKWPQKKDINLYEWENVLGSIDPPKVISRRGFLASYDSSDSSSSDSDDAEPKKKSRNSNVSSSSDDSDKAEPKKKSLKTNATIIKGFKMVRNYVKKKETGPKYSEDKLNRALEEIQASRLTIHRASTLYGIPFLTLYSRIKGTRGAIKKAKGRRTALAESIENVLATSIKTLAKWGFGLSRKEIFELVGHFVTKNDLQTPFKNGVPGEDWFLSFKKRHNLSIRKPEPLEFARKKSATDPFNIYGYFNLLKKVLVELDIENKPGRIWNLDESSLSIDPSKSRVVGEKGQSSSRVTSTSGKENTTFVLACNAMGQRVPPLIIFKGKNMWDQWKAPPDKEFSGTAYAATPNGWMETEVFKNYFKKSLVPALGDERPALVIYDGHSTHVLLGLVKYALDQRITILKLPAHTSDILQPLDVSVFKSYKQKWDQTIATWQRQHIGKKLPKSLFSQFLGETWTKVSDDVIKNGFKKAGIFPFDVDVVPKENFSKEALERWGRYQQQIERGVQDIEHVENARYGSPSLLTLPFFENVYETSSLQTLNVNSVDLQSSIIDTPRSQENPVHNPKFSQAASMEQLILSVIHQKQMPNKQKRRKVASGAEVITSAEIVKVLKDKEQIQSAKLIKTTPKTKIKRKQGKKTENSDSDITDIESVQVGSDVNKVKKVSKRKERRNLNRKQKSDDTESEESSEGNVSYAESDASEGMEDEDEQREDDEQYHSDKENNESRKTTVMKNRIGRVGMNKGRELAKEQIRTEREGSHEKANEERNIDNIEGPERTPTEEETEDKIQEILVNNWVLVKYALKKGPKYYVGVVQKKVGLRWEVKFVRRKGYNSRKTNSQFGDKVNSKKDEPLGDE
ncbi:unnamed protein product [Arctia plantaginis]|uniref:HTH CENPB-type domain-containing protein n=1 Tax=Arctia plantaginis TaxID=874455 RepID=A0A8S1AX54_ARCPL|nr:unnamed protein product [Arctia plantaginis]